MFCSKYVERMCNLIFNAISHYEIDIVLFEKIWITDRQLTLQSPRGTAETYTKYCRRYCSSKLIYQN